MGPRDTPSMEDMEFEIRQRLALMTAEERHKVTFLLLTMLRCFGIESRQEAALVFSDGTKLDIMGVNSPVPSTVHLVTMAYALLNENYGLTATFDASRDWLQ